MFRETLDVYLKRILDFLIYTKNYMIRKNPVQAMANSFVEGIKDFLTHRHSIEHSHWRRDADY